MNCDRRCKAENDDEALQVQIRQVDRLSLGSTCGAERYSGVGFANNEKADDEFVLCRMFRATVYLEQDDHRRSGIFDT